MLMATALMCLSLNLYHEARGEPLVGQLMVAQVTMNRAEQKPANVCKVVTARLQFSWTQGCVTPRGGAWEVRWECVPRDWQAWGQAVDTAVFALAGKSRELIAGDHFHVRSLRPKWIHQPGMQRLSIIGAHVFYRSRACSCK